jgi:hypothetical protein
MAILAECPMCHRKQKVKKSFVRAVRILTIMTMALLVEPIEGQRGCKLKKYLCR